MGGKACAKAMKKNLFWPRMTSDISKWAKQCEQCQRNKVHLHTHSFLEHLPEPTRRFSHIHVDLVGPINPPCESKNMMLTIIDRWTSWPEAIPISSRGNAASAAVCAKLLVHHWISKYGVPEVITSDRGSQFVSGVWNELSKILCFKRIQTTSYNPKSNGKVERLRARLDGNRHWVSELPWVLLGLRTTPNTDSGISPAILAFGQELQLPGQLVMPKKTIESPSAFGTELARAMANQSFTRPQWHTAKNRRRFVPADLQTCKYVLVRIDAAQPSLNPRYTGPHLVISRADKYFVVDLINRHDTVSIDRLIPFREPSYE